MKACIQWKDGFVEAIEVEGGGVFTPKEGQKMTMADVAKHLDQLASFNEVFTFIEGKKEKVILEENDDNGGRITWKQRMEKAKKEVDELGKHVEAVKSSDTDIMKIIKKHFPGVTNATVRGYSSDILRELMEEHPRTWSREREGHYWNYMRRKRA